MRCSIWVNAIIFSLPSFVCAPSIAFANCVVKEWIYFSAANAQEQSERIEFIWKVHSLWEALITLMPMRSTRIQHFKDVALRGFQYAIAFLLEVYAEMQTLLLHMYYRYMVSLFFILFF